jgi:anaerobic dimethyl sulfoxide reductase subunit A
MNKPNSGEEVINTICMDHCTTACLLRVHVKDGTVTRIETDDGGPGPQFRACAKGRASRQLLYHPDRVLYPLRRTGERGEGKFERISWDEALETVASQLKRVKATYGPRSTILMTSGGDFGYLHYGGLIDRALVKVGGYTGVHGTVSDKATEVAAQATFGWIHYMGASSRDNLLKARMIIFWGYNGAVTKCFGGHTPSVLTELKKTGAKMYYVDPRYTETAAFCDAKWIPIRPGTDAALAIAMAYVIINENLHDQPFLDKYTIGFDEFKQYVLGKEDGVPKTPAWAEEITGIPAGTIVALAKEYATTKPACIMDSFSPARSAFGEQFNRSLHVLTAMTGNIGIPGGGGGCGGMTGVDPLRPLFLCNGAHVHMSGGNNPVDLSSPYRKDSIEYAWAKRRSTFTLPEPGHYYFGGPTTAFLARAKVADAILTGQAGGYPADYKLLFLVTINWLNQYGNTNKIAQALKKLEFFVTIEQFMTPTAKFADIILPHNTLLERNDVVTCPIQFTGFRNKVVDSLGESKSMFEIAQGLADKLGVLESGDAKSMFGADGIGTQSSVVGLGGKTEEEWLREAVSSLGLDYDKIRKDAIERVPEGTPQSVVGHADQIRDPEHFPFPTPSGKIEIFSQSLADLNNPVLPPIPKYIEPWESRNDPLAGKYPLQLITSHFWRRTHGRFDTVPWTKELEPQSAYLNSIDAGKRGIKDGDMVRVYNDRGQILLQAAVTEKIMPGVVDVPEGAWYDPDKNGLDKGGCPNVLLSDVPSPGGGLCTNTALVQVEKA